MKLYPILLTFSFALTNASATDAQNLDLSSEVGTLKKFLIYPHLQKGFDSMERGHRDRAISEFEQAHSLAPNSVTITTYLAEAYRRFGQRNRAESLLAEQLTRNSGSAQLKKNLADLRAEMAQKVTSNASQTSSAASLSKEINELKLENTFKANPRAIPKPRSNRKNIGVKARTNKVAQHWPGKAARSQARLPVIDQAYLLADKAYQDSARGDFSAALPQAREAAALAPENRSYQKLFIYVLAQNGAYREAETNVARLLASNTTINDTELVLQRQAIRQRLAFVHFDTSNKALAAGSVESAVIEARKGVEYAPSLLPHRLQLLHSLIASGNIAEANQTATHAIRDLPNEPGLLVVRGYTYQRLGSSTLSKADFDKALEFAPLSDVDQQNFRIIAAYAALADNDAPRALSILKPLDAATDDAVRVIRKMVLERVQRSISPASVETLILSAPGIVCVGFSFAPSCDIWPGETPKDPGHTAAETAYKAYNEKDYATAILQAEVALRLSPNNASYRLLLVNAFIGANQLEQAEQWATKLITQYGDDAELFAARSKIRQNLGKIEPARQDADLAIKSNRLSLISEIELLIKLDRKPDARERFASADLEGQLNDQSDTTVAYLAALVGEDERAYKAFDRAHSQGLLPETALQDTAFTAARLGYNKVALKYFKKTVDAADSGRLPLLTQQQYNIRREIADRSRAWGATASLNYRGIPSSALAISQLGAARDSLQASAEAYWRPLDYSNGQLLELYSGISATLSSKAGYPTGQDSLQSALGIRVKPLANTNLILAVERRQALGSKATTDWLQRISYSESWGTDLQLASPSWTTANIYAEAGRYARQRQSYASFEGQIGRSYRLDNVHPKLVFFPHMVLGADYNSNFIGASKNALGLGAGVNLRYWFNEDRYNAPRSYNDVSLQYRTRIGGDDRARGVFMRFTLAY
jgi:bacteriophage N4 adsorption protein A